MKKIISLILVLILAVSMLAGCGGETKSSSESSKEFLLLMLIRNKAGMQNIIPAYGKSDCYPVVGFIAKAGWILLLVQ